MQEKFKDLLHKYKLEVFHKQHDKRNVEEILTECMHITEDVLKQKYHFHFNQLPNADRAEVINMINNYTREAILPPVVEKLVHRQVLLERRVDALVHLMEQLLEALSKEATSRAPAEHVFPELERQLERAGEQQLLEGLEALDPGARAAYLAELAGLDWRVIGELRALLAAPPGHAQGLLEPARAFPLGRDREQAELARRARAAGEDWLRSGAVAALTVAGGQASRLGWDAPKGVYPIGPLSGWSLFEIFARKLRRSGERHGFRPLWYLMTSPQNDAATRAFFEEHAWFGLEPGQLFFFPQAELPALSPEGRILRAAPGRLFLAPTGHGGVLSALRSSGALEHAREHGIERFSYFQVDNPLALPFDALFLGLHRLQGARMSSKVVARRDAAEKVGVLAWAGRTLACIEYSDLPQELRAARDVRGELVHSAGNIALHVIERALVEELTQGGLQLPWHLAHKSIGVVDARGRTAQVQGVKFETFVFDALRFSPQSAILEVERAAEFSPVKNRSGEDSPATARADLCRLHARWAESAGLALPGIGEHGVPAIEIDPLFADDAESLLGRVPAVPRRVRGGHLYT